MCHSVFQSVCLTFWDFSLASYIFKFWYVSVSLDLYFQVESGLQTLWPYYLTNDPIWLQCRGEGGDFVFLQIHIVYLKMNLFFTWIILLCRSDDDDDDYEIPDSEINKILIVTQTPPAFRKHPGGDRTGDHTPRAKITAEMTKLINDGLYYYEQDLWDDSEMMVGIAPRIAGNTTQVWLSVLPLELWVMVSLFPFLLSLLSLWANSVIRLTCMLWYFLMLIRFNRLFCQTLRS